MEQILQNIDWMSLLSAIWTIVLVLIGKQIYDWLNKNHFDYRGLIEKGLDIDATGLNIYKS